MPLPARQRSARGHPGQQQHEDGRDGAGPALDAAGRCRVQRPAGQVAHPLELRPGQRHLNGADQHRGARDGEAEPPVDALAEESGDQRRGERADLDADVDQRDAGLAAAAVLEHQVEQGLVVGLVEAHADGQQDERERRQPQQQRGGEREVARGGDGGAEHQGAPRAEQPVGDPAAGQAEHERQPDPGAEQRGGVRLGEPEPALVAGRDGEQHEDRLHAEEAEALPQVAHEQGAEPVGPGPQRGGGGRCAVRRGGRLLCRHAVGPPCGAASAAPARASRS